MAKRAKTGEATKAVLYVRVSTDEQALGPAAQLAAAKRWCEARGSQLVAVCEDLGVSGGAPLDKCPGLLSALRELEAKGAGVLLVAKRDRLARDVVKAAMVEQLAARAGAVVVSAAGEGEGTDPAAALMRTMVDAFAQYERALIGARTKAALAVKKARGEKLGGAAPYGWQLAADGVQLERCEAEQAVVATCRELKAEGWTLAAIGTELERRGLMPRNGGRWHPVRVFRVLEAAA
jgi:DNA invertase Pin-like site-specific DNA recombinase